MIRINLLPADQRRGNRLPAKVLAAAFGGAIAVSASIGWLGIVYFGDLGAIESELAQVEQKLTERERRVSYHDQLEANKKDYALRVQTIQDIGKSRRVWSRFLDELIDVVNNNGDTERHLAWFDSVAVKGDPKKGTLVSLPTRVQDDEKTRLANFFDDVAAAPFARELESITDPGYKVEVERVRIPAKSMQFRLDLQFQPTTKEAPKPAKGAPAAVPSPTTK